MGRRTSNGYYSRELDFPGYAQEFVRRNPEYQKQYAFIEHNSAKANLELREVMALKWGLSFSLPA